MKVDWTKISSLEQLLKYSSNFNYSPSSSDVNLIHDFYLLTSFMKSDFSLVDDNLISSYRQALTSIVDTLHQRYLQEFPYFFTNAFAWVIYSSFEGEKEAANGWVETIHNDLANKPQYQKIMDNFIKQIKSYENKYDNFFDATTQVLANKKINTPALLEMLIYFSSTHGDTEKTKPWVDGYYALKNANSLENKIIAIDHVIDLVHHSGAMFEYSPNLFRNENVPDYHKLNITDMLTAKSNASSLWYLYENCSSSLKPLISRLIYCFTNKTYEQYTNSNPSTKKPYFKEFEWYDYPDDHPKYTEGEKNSDLFNYANIHSIDDLIKYGKKNN